jgi:hypothetical protein
MPVSYKAKVTAIIPVNENALAGSSAHPVAAVFLQIADPVDYTAENTSNVLGGAGDSNMSVSTYAVSHTIAGILKPVDATVPSGVCASESTSAPLSVPHMFWRASTLAVSTSDDVPAQFDCLIDNSSSLVLIQNSLVDDLSLHYLN